MFHWQTEIAAEARRRRILDEMEAIRRIQRDSRAVSPRPGWFQHSMFLLGDWMMSAGQKLRCRYGWQPSDCGQAAVS